jgi:hypothetical protein
MWKGDSTARSDWRRKYSPWLVPLKTESCPLVCSWSCCFLWEMNQLLQTSSFNSLHSRSDFVGISDPAGQCTNQGKKKRRKIIFNQKKYTGCSKNVHNFQV